MSFPQHLATNERGICWFTIAHKAVWQQCAEYQSIVKTSPGSDKKFAKCTLVATWRCVAARGWEQVRARVRRCTFVHSSCTLVHSRPLKAGQIPLARTYRGRSLRRARHLLLYRCYCKPPHFIFQRPGVARQRRPGARSVHNNNNTHSTHARAPHPEAETEPSGGRSRGVRLGQWYSHPPCRSRAWLSSPGNWQDTSPVSVKIHTRENNCEIASCDIFFVSL